MLHKGCFFRKSFFHKLRQKVWLISKLLSHLGKKQLHVVILSHRLIITEGWEILLPTLKQSM